MYYTVSWSFHVRQVIRTWTISVVRHSGPCDQAVYYRDPSINSLQRASIHASPTSHKRPSSHSSPLLPWWINSAKCCTEAVASKRAIHAAGHTTFLTMHLQQQPQLLQGVCTRVGGSAGWVPHRVKHDAALPPCQHLDVSTRPFPPQHLWRSSCSVQTVQLPPPPTRWGEFRGCTFCRRAERLRLA